MKTPHLLSLSLALITLMPSPLQADETSMNAALSAWQQELDEYRAAVQYATDEAQRNKLLANAPDGNDTAKKLWKSIFYKTGTREVTEATTEATSRFDKPKVKKISVYAYEEPWAAPAVAWLLNKPETFDALVAREQISKVATALLGTVEKTHYSHPSMGDVCAPLATLSSLQAYECLKKIYNNNPEASARANAAIGLSIMLDKPQIRNVEGSEQMADAKRVFYIKSALNIAPEGCMFGKLRIEEVAINQLHLINKLSTGRIPPQIQVKENSVNKARTFTFPKPYQAQILLFWSPLNNDSIALMLRAQELAEKYPSIDIIPICAQTERDVIDMTYQNEGIEMPTYVDATGTAFDEYRINTVPTVALVSDKSQLLYLGYPDFNFQAKINSYIQSLAKLPTNMQPTPVTTPQESSAPADDAKSESQVPALREIPTL